MLPLCATLQMSFHFFKLMSSFQFLHWSHYGWSQNFAIGVWRGWYFKNISRLGEIIFGSLKKMNHCFKYFSTFTLYCVTEPICTAVGNFEFDKAERLISFTCLFFFFSDTLFWVASWTDTLQSQGSYDQEHYLSQIFFLFFNSSNFHRRDIILYFLLSQAL